MRYRLAEDAKPQLKLLLLATVITIALWFIPYTECLVYPIRLFVTFIHEGSHALVALLTGGSVQSLTVSSDGEGEVWSASSSWISSVLTSSAGYLGTMFFGVLLLFLIRRAISARVVLYGLGGFIGLLTLLFGFIVPLFNIVRRTGHAGEHRFYDRSGRGVGCRNAGDCAFRQCESGEFRGRFSRRPACFKRLLGFENAVLSNAPLVGSDIQTDAMNMQNATGLPAVAWILIWIWLSVVMISVGLRVYAVSQRGKQNDLPFED